jgi:hypothetical protein
MAANYVETLRQRVAKLRRMRVEQLRHIAVSAAITVVLMLLNVEFASCSKPQASETQVYRAINDKQVLRMRSGDEVELTRDGTNFVCNFSKENDALRLTLTMMGTPQPVYFRFVPQGLRSDDGTILYAPAEYQAVMQLRNEGLAFGKEAIQRIAVQHDANFLTSSLGPQAKLDLPPIAQQELMTRLQQLGTPVGPLNVQGDITFESQFFEPRGMFSTQLNYPAGTARIDLAISHPVGRWQIDTIGFSMGAHP